MINLICSKWVYKVQLYCVTNMIWCEPYMKMILDPTRSTSASSGRGRRRRRRTWWSRRRRRGEARPPRAKLQPNHPATPFPPFPIVLASSDAECSSIMYELQLWGLVCSSLSKQELLLVVQLKQTILLCGCNTTLATMGSDSALCCSLYIHFQAKLGWLSETSGHWRRSGQNSSSQGSRAWHVWESKSPLPKPLTSPALWSSLRDLVGQREATSGRQPRHLAYRNQRLRLTSSVSIRRLTGFHAAHP